MGQQHADGDRLVGRHGLVERTFGIDQHAHVAEGGEDLVDRLVEAQFALVDQDHRRHAGDGLGHRIDAVKRVLVHRCRLAEREGAAAYRVRVIFLPPAEGQEQVGELALRDIPVGERRDIGPAFGDIMCKRGAPERQARKRRAASEQRARAEQRTARDMRRGENVEGHRRESPNGFFARLFAAGRGPRQSAQGGLQARGVLSI